jgi:iron complex outermembrane recepter protein
LEIDDNAGDVMSTLRASFRLSAAVMAVSGVTPLWAQQAPVDSSPAPQAVTTAQPSITATPDVVVTGIRQSLTRAAQIKQNATQVVDSIVAQDIGKLPDPTTAAALQRVPGIQVSVDRNNELGDVRVRGLPDVLTTVNGREVFTTSGRLFNLQDLPAEALAGVDVYKSQSPDLIEGGLAGVIDLRLNRPFSFTKPTVVLSSRGNYGIRAGKLSPSFGGLATDRFQTGIGEIGVLVNATWQRNDYERDETILSGVRSSQATPLNTPGLLLPNIMQNFPEQGRLDRTQVDASVQWQAAPGVQFYLDGLYTRSRDRGAHYGANMQPYTTNVTLSNVHTNGQCFQANATAAGQNPTAGQAFTTQNLCYVDSATFNNLVSNQTTQARDDITTNKGIAGGLTFDRDGYKANIDVAYQTSVADNTLIIADVGQRLTSVTLSAGDDGVAHFTVPGDALTGRDNLYIRNSFQQNFQVTNGHLFAVKADAQKELGGILQNVKVGARYAERSADSEQVILNTAIPYGNIGTATESSAVKVSATGLPANFLALGSPAPDINGGTAFYTPNPDFLLSGAGQDALRALVGLPAGRPAYQPNLQFDARERTLSAYGELNYQIGLGGDATIDGVLGARLVQTKRSLDFIQSTTSGASTIYTPVRADTTDRDILPTATARLKLTRGLQARLGYSKSIRRPDFTDLNPVVTLSLSNNPFVQSGGSAGNPDLKEQKSDNYDATLEYYFHSGYLAVAAYSRKITNRVLSGAAPEVYGGVTYSVTRPRNLGEASLKGLELSGQYFADFLPGALSGLGVQGAFTLADSKVEGSDPLAGNPLQGVSKYNFTSGLLYEKHGVSGRLVYTYRSKYFSSDQTGSISVRPVGTTSLISYVRPAGRLDFNVGYDVNKNVRVDIGGTNVLRSMTRDYLGQSFETFEAFYDETTYSVGVRVRL